MKISSAHWTLGFTVFYLLLSSQCTAEESATPVLSSSRARVPFTQRSNDVVYDDPSPGPPSLATAILHTNSTTDHSDPDHFGHDTDGIVLIPVHFYHVEYPLIFTIVVIFAGLSKLAFHYSHFLSSKVPESCVLIVIGLVFGAVLHYSGATRSVKLYEPHEFFLFLLPPIILESAFSLHDRTFAENVGGVLLFAVLGTVLNCFLIGLTLYGLYQANAMEEIHATFVQMLLFSSLIVAVDPVAVLAVFQEVGVNNTLYFLVFGESLLNDGVTVVLYNVMQTFNKMDSIAPIQILLGVAKFFVVVLFGFAVGVVCGLVSSYITKFTNTVKVVEPLIVLGFAYLSYLVSELFEFSGIVSIIACGIIQVHYAFHNISKKAKLTIRFFTKVIATASEIIIFLFLGIVTMDQQHVWKTGFTLWTLFFCVIYRFLVTYGISICINKFSTARVRRIRLDEMFMISYGGLRGAVCFSLVALIDENEVPMKRLFVTTTLFVIFFTVFVQGGTIKFLVKKLRIKLAVNTNEMKISEAVTSRVFDHITAGVEEILGYTTGDHHIKEKLDHIDDTVVRPLILRVATKSDLEEISLYYEKLVMKEHYKNLQLSGAKLPRVKTEIRHLDSELALQQLDINGYESSSNNGHDEEYGGRYSNRVRFHVGDDSDNDSVTHSNPRLDRGGKEHVHFEEKNDSSHGFLSNTMHTVRSVLHMNGDTKSQSPNRRKLLSMLHRKRRKNNALRDMRSKGGELLEPNPPPLSLSFNLDGSRAYDEHRSSQANMRSAHDTVRDIDETQGSRPPSNPNGHITPMIEITDCSEEEEGKVKFIL